MRLSSIGLVLGAFLLTVSGICKAALMFENESAFFFRFSNNRKAAECKLSLYESTSAFTYSMEMEVEKMSDSEIVSCNFDEWANYLATKYSVIPISIFETNIERRLTEAKVKRANPFRGAPYERDYFEVDGVRITFKIPYDGEPKLFEVRPSTFIMSRFSTRSFVAPHEENCGSFTLEFEYTKQELQEKGDAMADYVQRQFEHEFESYKKMIAL